MRNRLLFFKSICSNGAMAESLVIFCSLLIAHCSLLIAHCSLLKPGNFDGIGAFFAFFNIEFHPVAFLNFMDEAGLVDENFFLIVIGDDEAEAFGIVVKLNGTGKHNGGGGDDNETPLQLPVAVCWEWLAQE